MSSKDIILNNIRQNTKRDFPMPNLDKLESEAIVFENKIKQFTSIIKQMGGKVVVAKDGDNINDIIRQAYPEAKRVASTFDKVEVLGQPQQITCATFHADEMEKSADLNGTDLAIVHGRLGVCENGSVWLPQDVEQRAVYFISEALVIVLDRNTLVNNMHEAYPLIDSGERGFGVFISGPSKTADIEQALVMGAHGASDVTVVLV